MTSIPVFDQDLFADDFIRDPYPGYAAMRDLGAVVWLPTLGNYALTRHREVQAALRDHTTFISRCGVAADQFGCDFLQGNTVASDGDRHTELRRAMAAPMLPGELGHIKSAVQNAADQLIDDLLSRDQFDVVTDLAQHLPLTIVREMVGLPDFGQQRMLQWAAAAFDVLGVQNERGRDALATIADMRSFIEQDATRENLRPGSWTRRVHELVDQQRLAAELAPFAIRDYINPSLDTTISATAELIFQLAANPQQWQRLKQQPELINRAVNEAIRLATPIRSFSRHTSTDTTIAGHQIKKGSRVMMLFACANRDERVFSNPDQFDITRNPRKHLGFGSGVHMCVGMHLAQLEMEALLHAMISRVASLTTETPTIKLNNTIRAYATLPCRFEREQRSLPVSSIASDSAAEQHGTDDTNTMIYGQINKRYVVAKNIICLELTPHNGTAFPPYDAGAHISLQLPNGHTRQYSLTGAPEPERYRIAILKTADSLGGSQWLHQHASAGDVLQFSPPRNFFPLLEHNGHVYLFAGGIGLTPLLSMAWALHRAQRNFTLHIYVRSTDHLPFRDDLQQWPFQQQVVVHEHKQADNNTPQTLNIEPLIHTPANAALYVCGPQGFMETVTVQACNAGIAAQSVYREHFSAEIDPDGDALTLIARRSGKTLQVPANTTILSALTDAGIAVETSCENGVCGSCLTNVLEGTPEHRDMVQTDSEKSSNRQIAVCCSRSQSSTLVLDI
jgi:cytochrome P450/ferredoxin-NADP reductase